jgi:hypothetical protein
MGGAGFHKPAGGASWRGLAAHPSAPAGGGGPGFSRVAGPAGVGATPAAIPSTHKDQPLLSRGAGAETTADPVASPEVTIQFGANAQRLAVSEHTLTVLKAILKAARLASALITSTSRTPADQARAMYDNLETQGIQKQKRLYGSAGDKVIDAYAKAKAAKKSKEDILAAMEARIKELGPSRVSKHCASGALLQVVDVAPSSIEVKPRFVKAVQAEKRVARFLRPPLDPAYHLEIPQPASPGARKDVAPPPPPPPPKKQEKTWIEFKVVEDGTGKPVPGVRLRITTPDGIENFYTTNASGLVRIEGLEAGTCEVGEVLDNDALEVVAVA